MASQQKSAYTVCSPKTPSRYQAAYKSSGISQAYTLSRHYLTKKQPGSASQNGGSYAQKYKPRTLNKQQSELLRQKNVIHMELLDIMRYIDNNLSKEFSRVAIPCLQSATETLLGKNSTPTHNQHQPAAEKSMISSIAPPSQPSERTLNQESGLKIITNYSPSNQPNEQALSPIHDLEFNNIDTLQEVPEEVGRQSRTNTVTQSHRRQSQTSTTNHFTHQNLSEIGSAPRHLAEFRNNSRINLQKQILGNKWTVVSDNPILSFGYNYFDLVAKHPSSQKLLTPIIKVLSKNHSSSKKSILGHSRRLSLEGRNYKSHQLIPHQHYVVLSQHSRTLLLQMVEMAKADSVFFLVEYFEIVQSLILYVLQLMLPSYLIQSLHTSRVHVKEIFSILSQQLYLKIRWRNPKVMRQSGMRLEENESGEQESEAEALSDSLTFVRFDLRSDIIQEEESSTQDSHRGFRVCFDDEQFYSFLNEMSAQAMRTQIIEQER